MKVKNALGFAAEQLYKSSLPALDARLLLAHLLSVDASYFIIHAQERLSTDSIESFFGLVARAQRGEPIPYITGRTYFYDSLLTITPDVLIPRPDTELVVDKAIKWAKQSEAKTAADVGTGSGCIAISLAKALPQLDVTAIDISEHALALAKQNSLDNGTTVRFLHGSLLEPLSEKVDLIIANLPYVTDDEWLQLEDDVRLFEPSLALKGGADGLDLIRVLLQQAQTRLNGDGAIFLEIGWQQGVETVKLAHSYFPEAQIDCLQDYSDNDRIVQIFL